jgi:Uma2 family endonuclease
MSAQPKIPIRAAEYHQRPESTEPEQLIGGEIIASPAPSLEHQRIVRRLTRLIEDRATDGEVFNAPTDVELDDLNVVQPDVLWVSESNTHCMAVDDKYFRGAPDFVAKILSPGTARYDRKGKFRLYEQHGVRELWIIDAVERLVEVWTLRGAQLTQVGLYESGDSFSSPLFGEIEVAIFLPE